MAADLDSVAQALAGKYVFQAGKLGDDDGRGSGSEEKSNEELKNLSWTIIPT